MLSELKIRMLKVFGKRYESRYAKLRLVWQAARIKIYNVWRLASELGG